MRTLPALLTLALAGCVVHSNRPRSPGPEGPPLTKTDLERLSAAGISDPVIVELIDRRGVVRLSSDDVVAVKKAGATDEIIQKAIASERQEPPPVPMAVPIYYYHYYYPYYWWYPSVYVGTTVGFGSYRYWGHRGRVGIGFGW